MNLIQYTNFKEFLEIHFKKRIAKNKSYSLRAFSRDLGVSVPQLSRFMSGNRGLSYTSAEKILNAFKLPSLEKKFLLSSILQDFARSQTERDRGSEEIKGYRATNYQALKDDEFSKIKEWHHLAILTLMELPKFRFDLHWISKQLGIHVEIAAIAITRMIELGLITKKGNHLEINRNYLAFSDAPNEALRDYHRQIITKTVEAVTNQPSSERLSASLFLSARESQFEEASAVLREFSVAFAKRFSTDLPKERRDSVYAFTAHFFKVCSTTQEEIHQDDSKITAG